MASRAVPKRRVSMTAVGESSSSGAAGGSAQGLRRNSVTGAPSKLRATGESSAASQVSATARVRRNTIHDLPRASTPFVGNSALVEHSSPKLHSFRKTVKKVLHTRKSGLSPKQQAAMDALKEAESIMKRISEPKPTPMSPTIAEGAPADEVEEDIALVEDGEEQTSERASLSSEAGSSPLEAEAETERGVIEEDIYVHDAPVKGTITVEINDFNHDFEIQDGKLQWEAVDERFGITSGCFDETRYATRFGADFHRPMFLKSELEKVGEDAEEVDEPFSRDCYFGLIVGETYVLRLPTVTEAKQPPPKPPTTCRLKFNHYNKEFEIEDGEIQWSTIDKVFCVSFAYKGSFGREIYDEKGELLGQSDDQETYFGFESGSVYTLKITEDESLSDLPRRAYKGVGSGVFGNKTLWGAPGSESSNSMQVRKQFELGEDSASCSCGEGNPCMSAYNCKNWQQRFEIAKANGWKGHS